MAETITVKGRLIGPTTVELLEPVAVAIANDDVDVVVRAADGGRRERTLRLIEHLQSLPPGTRTREEIDHQIEEERSSWER